MISVSFDVAKKMKEKSIYAVSSSMNGHSLYNEEGQKITSMVYGKNEMEKCFSRPSQEKLCQVLRETYKIHCSVAPWRESFVSSGIKQHRTVYEGNVIDEKNDWKTNQISSFSKEHAQCMDECLLFALNLIP